MSSIQRYKNVPLWVNVNSTSGINQFKKLIDEFPKVNYWQPAPDIAPWNLLGMVGGVTVNFWPSKCKACWPGEKSIMGYEKIRMRMLEASQEEVLSAVIDDEDISW